MTISLHDIEAWVGTQKLDVIDASISMDESWSPYVQGQIQTVLNEDLLDDLDPRTGGRIHIYVSQAYGLSDKLSELTAAYSGDTIADVTAEWTGQTLADISATYFHPFNASFSNKLSTLSSTYGGMTIAEITANWDGLTVADISERYWRSYPSGIYNNYRRGFDLTIRSRETNIVDGTLTMQLSSDEALLQDYALVSSLNFSPSSLQLRNIIKEVIANIGGYLVDGANDATVDASAALWAPGQNAWDYLEPLVQKAGFRLYCDERRNWFLVDDTFTQPGIVELFSQGTITNTSDNISRDNDEWFDAVVVKYVWTDLSGATIETYDTAAVEGFKKVKLIEIQSNYPGAGAAQRILDRAIARGRQLDVTAVSNYNVTPSTECDIYIVGYPTENVVVQAVTWNYPGDTMTIKTRQPVTT